MSAPKRIQRKRTKGWRMPEGAVYVGRPSRWGNPFAIGPAVHYSQQYGGGAGMNTSPHAAASFFARWLFGEIWDCEIPVYDDDGTRVSRLIAAPPSLNQIRAELAGRDLACWCPLDQPCHADVLLELANREAS